MNPFARKLNLTAHVTSSLGWFGAVAAFLVLGIAGVRSSDGETVRAVYVSMNLIGRWMIVPLSLLALTTGLIQSLGTPWGLFRYYWVTMKFALTIAATALLLLHQFTAVEAAAARVTSSPVNTLPALGELGPQLVADAGFALVVLLTIAILSVFKPWGRTAYGQRVQRRAPPAEHRSMV